MIDLDFLIVIEFGNIEYRDLLIFLIKFSKFIVFSITYIVL